MFLGFLSAEFINYSVLLSLEVLLLVEGAQTWGVNHISQEHQLGLCGQHQSWKSSDSGKGFEILCLPSWHCHSCTVIAHSSFSDLNVNGVFSYVEEAEQSQLHSKKSPKTTFNCPLWLWYWTLPTCKMNTQLLKDFDEHQGSC